MHFLFDARNLRPNLRSRPVVGDTPPRAVFVASLAAAAPAPTMGMPPVVAARRAAR